MTRTAAWQHIVAMLFAVAMVMVLKVQDFDLNRIAPVSDAWFRVYTPYFPGLARVREHEVFSPRYAHTHKIVFLGASAVDSVGCDATWVKADPRRLPEHNADASCSITGQMNDLLAKEGVRDWRAFDLARNGSKFTPMLYVYSNPIVWPLEAVEPIIPPARVMRPGRRFVMSAGRLDDNKNFQALVRMFAKVAPQHPEWDLVVLGEGERRAELEGMIRSLGLEGRVFLPGRVGNIGHWLEASSLFTLTSHVEGFPNVLLEARACGVPAVSFDCKTGPRDILTEGVDGYLIEPGDEAGFAAALDALMGDDQKRQAMGAAEGKLGRFEMGAVMEQWSAVIG